MTDTPRAPLTSSERFRILFYSGTIIAALHFVNLSAGVQVIPLSFLLKNKLHLSANDLASFGLWAAIPGYLAFAFGLARDFWSPFGLGDRGYFLLFGFLAAAIYGAFAFLGVSVPMLFISTMLCGICFLFCWGAWNGLGSTIGQRHAMSGQISALWNFVGTAAIGVALTLGGFLSQHLETLSAAGAVRTLYMLMAVLMAGIGALGLWKPRAVFAGLGRKSEDHLLADLARLARHWPIYPALTAWLLWNFSPGTLTVLQYYLTDQMHASDVQWSLYNTISFLAALPAFALFGLLSSRFSLRTLLWGGAALGTFQMIPLLFIHSADGALIAAVPIGLIGGMATAAIMDLLIRACPKGMEGTMMMMAWSMYALAVNVGNWWGTDLYDHHGGFVACVIATTAVYALILPVLLLVPRKLIATADGNIE
ncbi:MAG TPA: MFS transporter [Rhizomicrobium sp.]|jgi:Na+/melibiose symporter-like transporter